MSQHESSYKNPYAFVSLEGQGATLPDNVSWQKLPQDRWAAHLNTGIIEAALTTETPLFIHGADQQQARQRAFIRDVQGHVYIPATSLKGPLRAVAETAGNGCLGVLSDEHEVSYRQRKELQPHQLPRGYRPCTKADEACVTCLLFGMTEEGDNGKDEEKRTSLAGRVYISDARPLSRLTSVNVDIPEPRGGPRPKHTSFYFDAQGRILGRKFYYHHLSYRDSLNLYFDVDRYRPDPVTLEAVEGPFTFTVRFHNLTDTELDLLVYTLALEDNLRHHLGFAKPYGLGSACIEIQRLRTEARQNGVPARYLALDADPDQVWIEETWRPRRDRAKNRWRARTGGAESHDAFTHIMRWTDRELYQYPPYLWFRDQRQTTRPETLAQYQAAGTGDTPGPDGSPGGRSYEGTVNWFHAEKGFGFIRPRSGGDDVFVHITAVEGQKKLRQGQRVAFNTRETPKGPQAVDVIVITRESDT